MSVPTDSGDWKNSEPDKVRHDVHHSVLLDSKIRGVDESSVENPLLISNILDQIFEHLPPSFQLTLRSVCKLWNELLVPKINKNGSVALLKIINRDEKAKKLKLPFIDIKEVVVTMEAGGLEHSILSRIYFDDSMEPNLDLFQIFLDMNGKNIRTLHYDGNSMEQLGRIFKACSQNLVNLSLWKLLDPQKTWYKREKSFGNFENEGNQFQFPKLESIVLVSGNDLHILMSVHYDEYDSECCEGVHFYPIGGRCNPSQEFIEEIIRASPKFNSLSARLCDSSILEALAGTNSFRKLSTLCIKSRIDISQLRVLCCAGAEMKLKNLILRGLFVELGDSTHDNYGMNTKDPNYKRRTSESREFAPLLLKFLKTQAKTLEFLSIHLFNKRQWMMEDIPIMELFEHFPIMPKLLTLIMDKIEKRMDLSRLSILFPKLKNLGETRAHWKEDKRWFYGDESNGEYVDHEIELDVNDISWIQEYPLLIIPSPESSTSSLNLLGMNPTLELVQVFPGITEFHSTITFDYAKFPHRLPELCPLLKHLYFHIDLLNTNSRNVIKFIRRFNMFMVGIHPEECAEIEEISSFNELKKIQLPRSRPSILDLKDLETLDIRFSCYDFNDSCRMPCVEPALGVLTTCGLQRMTQLKKLKFQLDFKPLPKEEHSVPYFLVSLKKKFKTEENFETRSKGFGGPLVESVPGNSGKRFVLGFNMNHHTSEWNQFNFFPDDPDIYNLGLEKDVGFSYYTKTCLQLTVTGLTKITNIVDIR